MTDSQLLKNAHAVKACLKAHASSLPCKYDICIYIVQTCDDQFIYRRGWHFVKFLINGTVQGTICFVFCRKKLRHIGM